MTQDETLKKERSLTLKNDTVTYKSPSRLHNSQRERGILRATDFWIISRPRYYDTWKMFKEVFKNCSL